ncbi:ATP-binding protein [Acrocarpospora macrocephala]|uniref:histidine kinase n=1 Tax=Acrocarpospora macrocephala TaxID=150177 RepID=A0A5M3WI95_9ACTN|nr:HAMP domain-containing sensor histidine kinase [Acrocarpospora macrocephala]GES08426.1 two-component sensor histidine kinase [Acrocarpospora macrocephala]
MTRPPRHPRRTAWAAVRRLLALPLTIRLTLSHLTVLVVSLLVMNSTSDMFWRQGPATGRTDLEALVAALVGPGEGDIVFEMVVPALAVGMIAALGLSLVFSRFLLRPLRQVSAATHRLADGHYDDVLTVPREPGLAALVEDVNRLAAALADIERRRARLVSEIAHEMRTPITILNGQIEGMADGIFTPDDAMFASLTDDLTRLRRLTDDLSNLSRVEEGAFTLRHSLTDVTALTRTTVEKLRPQFDDGQVTLAMTPGPPVKARLDSGRIAQVLVNLLGNALRACDPGGRVSVTVRTGASPAPHVEITVQDDGIGIAAHDLTRIFTRFERVEHPGRPAPAGGSGIGLTIARGITRAHGGGITATSDGLGQGATFTVRLPLAPPGA